MNIKLEIGKMYNLSQTSGVSTYQTLVIPIGKESTGYMYVYEFFLWKDDIWNKAVYSDHILSNINNPILEFFEACDKEDKRTIISGIFKEIILR